MYIFQTSEQGLYLRNSKNICTKGIVIYTVILSSIYIIITFSQLS